MKILVVGSGGREHAIAWRLAQDDRVETVYVAPGNAGTALTKKLINVPESDIARLADFVKTNDVRFTVVGPEAPLAAGIVDYFRANGLKIFGPTKAAAQLESSKDFAKAFMKRHGVPTADYETFTRRSSLKPMAWPPARVSLSPWISHKPIKRLTVCSRATPLARPGLESLLKIS